jgi:signal transduction histidine kinase
MGRLRIKLSAPIAALLLGACSPVPFSQSVSDFITALNQAPAVVTIPLAALQQLDPLLLRPGSLYPQFTTTPLPVLSALYRYHQQCSGPTDALTDAMRQFEQALCQHTELPPEWFQTHPISPLGGSTAWYYLQRHPKDAAALQSFLHVRERPDALGGIGQLSDDNLEALANGQNWLLQNGNLWYQQQQQWRRYAPDIWQPLARKSGLTLQAAGPQCEAPLGTLCANPVKSYALGWRSLLGITGLIAVLSLLWLAWQRRKMQQRQRFIVQMLTHELRTPIAQLGNVVEHFRRDFDNLPPQAQAGFGALADSVQRMRQMAQASQHYLSAEGQRNLLEVPSTVWLSEWLSHIAESWSGLTYCLGRDRELTLPLYWTSLCLNNLLANAFRHGRAPVRLTVDWDRGRLSMQVSDGGTLAVTTLPQLLSQHSPHPGMGLGLSIVMRVIKRLNGRLTLSTAPTTFTLELPCDATH